MEPKPDIPEIRFLTRTLHRSGGFYLMLAILVSQLSNSLVIAPIAAVIQSNTRLTGPELSSTLQIILLLISFSTIILLAVTYFISRNAFHRLQDWARRGTARLDAAQEQNAWREITSLPRNYGILAALISLLLVIGPLLAYQSLVLRLNFEQLIYTLISGLAGALVIITAGPLGLEHFLQPAREILLPADFQAQRNGISAISIPWKLQIFTLALIGISILIVAPLGYTKLMTVVQGTDPAQALRTYQTQSLLIAFGILIIAAALTMLMARMFSNPFRQLVDVVRKVEQGELTQRVRVIATDEVGELEIYFNRMIARLESLQTSLEKQVTERTAQLAAVNEIGLSVNAILDPGELIEKVVNLITDRFGHYYSAIFLLDSTGKWAELRNATGEAGRVLRESHHRLAVDGKSMVGTAVHQKQARIALDIGAEPVRFDNPILPYTRSEIALPLIAGDRVLGALDVQSTKQSAFGPQDVETFQNMANQVVIALENARLFKEMNERLQEVQSVQRQYLREAWTSQATRENLEYGVGDETASENEIALDVPLALRDQIIGQIKLTGEAEWLPEERAWVESVATQTAIALENARLMEESREQATLERTVAEITTKIWSASTIDGILQTAVKEIGRALNLSEATIELRTEEEGESR